MSYIPNIPRWKGTWAPGKYYPYDMVFDNQFLMIALNATEDRPAPQPLGFPEPGLPSPPSWTTQTVNSGVYSGHRYNFSEPGWLTNIRVWVTELTAATSYRVVVVDETNPTKPIVSIFNNLNLTVGVWNDIALGNKIILKGTKLKVYLDALDSSSSNVITGPWTYASGNTTVPLSTRWAKNNQNSEIRIHKTDNDSADRSADLLSIIPDSIIKFTDTGTPSTVWEFLVTGGLTDEGAYVTYPVQLISDIGTLIEVPFTVDFDIPIVVGTEYVEELNYLPANQPTWATVTGILEINGAPQVGVTDNAYGVNISFQRAYISPDWGFAGT